MFRQLKGYVKEQIMIFPANNSSAEKGRSSKAASASMNAARELIKPTVDVTAQNLVADTKNDPKKIEKAKSHTKELRNDMNRYGVLRCDYEYAPTRGDPGEPRSFPPDSTLTILKVEGWTFEAAQRGVSDTGAYPASEFRLVKADGTTDTYWKKLWDAFPDGNSINIEIDSPGVEDDEKPNSNRKGYRRVTEKVKGDRWTEGYFEEEDYTKGLVYRYDPQVVEQHMREAIWHLEDAEVCGVTADVGFSQAFQTSVQCMTSLPVMLSSLQQLSLVTKMWDLRPETKNKIVIMTANIKSFDKNRLIPDGVDHDCLEVVGMENSAFGKWVAGGNSFTRFREDAYDAGASVEDGLDSMCEECKRAIDKVTQEGGKVVCIVQECAEMPAYSNGLRRRFKVPVYDTMTAIAFVQMGRGFSEYSSFMM